MKVIVGLCRNRKITLVVEEEILYLHYNGVHMFKWNNRNFPHIYYNGTYKICIRILDSKQIILEINMLPKNQYSSQIVIDHFYLQINYDEFIEIFYEK